MKTDYCLEISFPLEMKDSLEKKVIDLIGEADGCTTRDEWRDLDWFFDDLSLAMSALTIVVDAKGLEPQYVSICLSRETVE